MNAVVLRRGLANGWKGLLITAAVVAFFARVEPEALSPVAP